MNFLLKKSPSWHSVRASMNSKPISFYWNNSGISIDSNRVGSLDPDCLNSSVVNSDSAAQTEATM